MIWKPIPCSLKTDTIEARQAIDPKIFYFWSFMLVLSPYDFRLFKKKSAKMESSFLLIHFYLKKDKKYFHAT